MPDRLLAAGRGCRQCLGGIGIEREPPFGSDGVLLDLIFLLTLMNARSSLDDDFLEQYGVDAGRRDRGVDATGQLFFQAVKPD